MRLLRASLSVDVEAQIHRILSLSPHEIKTLTHDPKTPGLTAAIGSILIKALNTGDPRYIGYLLERTIGAVQKNVKIEMPDDPEEKEKRERLRRLEAENEAIIEMLKENGCKGID